MAETNNDIRQFHATKRNEIRYITIEINHPSIITRRFVNNQATAKTFTVNGGSMTFEPLNFEVPRPSQREQEQSSITVKLGRLGSDFLNEIKKITAFGWMQQGELIYREIYPNGDLKAFEFSISDVRISTQSVNIVASDDNPINYRVSKIYTIGQFPGLETV
jgi:hypothetical protein